MRSQMKFISLFTLLFFSTCFLGTDVLLAQDSPNFVYDFSNDDKEIVELEERQSSYQSMLDKMSSSNRLSRKKYLAIKNQKAILDQARRAHWATYSER